MDLYLSTYPSTASESISARDVRLIDLTDISNHIPARGHPQHSHTIRWVRPSCTTLLKMHICIMEYAGGASNIWTQHLPAGAVNRTNVLVVILILTGPNSSRYPRPCAVLFTKTWAQTALMKILNSEGWQWPWYWGKQCSSAFENWNWTRLKMILCLLLFVWQKS